MELLLSRLLISAVLLATGLACPGAVTDDLCTINTPLNFTNPGILRIQNSSLDVQADIGLIYHVTKTKFAQVFAKLRYIV